MVPKPSLQKPLSQTDFLLTYKMTQGSCIPFFIQPVRTEDSRAGCGPQGKPKKCWKKILSVRHPLSCTKIDGDTSTEDDVGCLVRNPARLGWRIVWSLNFRDAVKMSSSVKKVTSSLRIICALPNMTPYTMHFYATFLSELKQQLLMWYHTLFIQLNYMFSNWTLPIYPYFLSISSPNMLIATNFNFNFINF